MRCNLSLAAALALSVTGVAQAAEPTVTPPDWLRRPRPEQLMSVWPTRARETGRGGKATIACTVTTEGALRDCVVLNEEPAGMGFGGAAIALTPQLLMKPATANGVPVPSKIGIPVEFPNFMPPDAAMQTSAVATGVRWTQAPSFDEVVAAYPAKAREKGVTGRATLVCSFADDGRLKNCSTLTQTPASAGFAAAAKKLTPLFVGPTERPDGKPMKGVLVQIPFTFTENMLKGGKASVGKPAWAAVPDFASMAANFPTAARAKGVFTARVHLTCSVAANGAVEGCKTVLEEPGGLGFAEAALALTPAFRMNVWSDEGLPVVGGQITIPIRYQFAAPASQPAKPGP